MTVSTRWLQVGGRRVPLLAGPDALAELPQALAQAGFEGRLFIVADEQAMRLHGDRLPEAPLLCIYGAEEDKNLAQVSGVWDWLVEQTAQRRDAVLAFGGGVVCDLAGFAAASYLRGIGLINVPTTLLAPVVARSIELKAEIVERDERESGDRMLLNYGHTIGHALEAAAGYGTLLHGEAVAVGMRAAALIALELDVLDHGSADRQQALLARLGLPEQWPDVSADEVWPRMALDKKRAGSVQRWVLAHGVGCAQVHTDVPVPVARRALDAVTSR